MTLPYRFGLAFMFLGALTVSLASGQQQQVEQIDVLSQSGGILQSSPATSSSSLSYQRCTSSSADQQALLKMNVIGAGAGQIPAGSEIISATLRLRAQSGGDGLLYRAGEPWDSTPTWNEVGDVLTAGSSIGVGLSTGQSSEFDVTDHVELWANGTSNQGWVIKGWVDDCQAAEIYGGTASAGNRPRLTVTFVPPDTTPPRIESVVLSSPLTTHADYPVPVGDGDQIRTAPLATVKRVFITFDENIAQPTLSDFSLVGADSGTTYTLAGVAYNPATLTATVTFAGAGVGPDQLVFTAKSSITDVAGNNLDGDWTNPSNLTDTGTDTFPSGNGAPGPDFVFRFTVLPGDYNLDNKVILTDYTRWRDNYPTASGASFTNGDGDGDGDVDGTDYQIYNANYGTNYTSW